MSEDVPPDSLGPATGHHCVAKGLQIASVSRQDV